MQDWKNHHALKLSWMIFSTKSQKTKVKCCSQLTPYTQLHRILKNIISCWQNIALVSKSQPNSQGDHLPNTPAGTFFLFLWLNLRFAKTQKVHSRKNSTLDKCKSSYGLHIQGKLTPLTEVLSILRKSTMHHSYLLIRSGKAFYDMYHSKDWTVPGFSPYCKQITQNPDHWSSCRSLDNTFFQKHQSHRTWTTGDFYLWPSHRVITVHLDTTHIKNICLNCNFGITQMCQCSLGMCSSPIETNNQDSKESKVKK